MRIRKTVSRLHAYLGLAVAVFGIVTGLSGSLLVFRHEIDRQLYPHLRLTEPQGQSPLGVNDIIQAVRRAFPQQQPARIGFPTQPNGTFEVWLGNSRGRRVYVDAFTGKVLGSQQANRTYRGVLRDVHVQWMLGETGETFAGLIALAVIILICSGTFLWWPGRGKIARNLRVRRGVSWRVWFFDLHRLTGVLFGWLLLFTALSGATLVFDGPLKILAGEAAPPRVAEPKTPADVDGKRKAMDLDELLETARRVVPGANVTWVILPKKETAPLLVRMKLPNESHPNGKNYVYLNPYTGDVLDVWRTADAPWQRSVTNARYPIHTGEIAGRIGRTVILLLGITLIVLCVSGTTSWWLRPRRRQQSTISS